MIAARAVIAEKSNHMNILEAQPELTTAAALGHVVATRKNSVDGADATAEEGG